VSETVQWGIFVHRLPWQQSEGGAISVRLLGVDCLSTGSVCVQSTFSCLGTEALHI
jgi:hypothetical protein